MIWVLNEPNTYNEKARKNTEQVRKIVSSEE